MIQNEDIRKAAIHVVEKQEATTNCLQIEFAWGYNKGERVMRKLEELRIVLPAEAFLPRKVIVKDLEGLNDLILKHEEKTIHEENTNNSL